MDINERLMAVSELLPSLVSFAEAPFELETYKTICRSRSWAVDSVGDTFFTAWSHDPNFLFKAAMDRDESSAGLAICAVGDIVEQPDFYLETKEDLDTAYLSTLQIARESLGEPVKAGVYQWTPLSISYHFAYWPYTYAVLVLIEHGETEFTNNPSLEFRLVPRCDKKPPELPLRTNLLLC